MRLRRSVVLGLAQRYGVVPPLLTGRGRGGRRSLDRSGPGLRYPDRRLLLRSAVRGGGRQGEDRTRPRLLRGGPLGRGGQRTAPPPGGLPLVVGTLRTRRTLGTRRALAPGRRQGGGQRGLRSLLGAGAGVLPGGHGHTTRRHGGPESRTGGGGPRGMLGRGHHGSFAHPVGTGVGTRGIELGGPPAAPPGTTGRALRGLGRNLGRLVGRPGRAPAAASGGRLTGRRARTGQVGVEEGVRGAPPRPPPTAVEGLLRRLGELRLYGRCHDGARAASERHLQDVRVAAHARHLVRLEHTAVGAHDPAHDRLVHRVPAGVRPAHLDPGDRTALRGRDDHGVVEVTTRGDGRVAGGVDARDVRHQVRERGGEPLRVDLGLDGRRVHGELHPAGADQLHRAVDTGGDDGVQHHLRTGDALGARVDPLIGEDVVDEGGDPRVPGGEVVQHLVGLGPQLPGVVGGQGGQFAPQFVQGAAQRPGDQGEQLLVPPGQCLVPVLLPLAERGVPLLARRQLLRVLLTQLGQLGVVLLAQLRHLGGMFLPQRGEVGGVFLGELLQLLGVRLLQRGLLVHQGVEGPPVGEGHHGADELVPVAHRRGGQIDRHLVVALGPQHLPAHPVLAPGAQGVGERRLGVREGEPSARECRTRLCSSLPPSSPAR